NLASGINTFGGVIQNGTGNPMIALTKSGNGTLILSGTNTFTGGTTISAGTLQLGNGGTTGTVPGNTITDNGTLAFSRSDTVTYSPVVSGSGALSQLGPGNLILTGANTYTGATQVSGGTLTVNTALPNT